MFQQTKSAEAELYVCIWIPVKTLDLTVTITNREQYFIIYIFPRHEHIFKHLMLNPLVNTY